MEVTIFGKGAGANGAGTLMFKNVTKLRSTLFSLKFNYVSASTGAVKKMKLKKSEFLGFSYVIKEKK